MVSSGEFNFEQKELGVLKEFLNQTKYKVVVVGSFALYGIKNQNNNSEEFHLKFNDLDIDLYKSLYNELSKSLVTEKRREEKLSIKIGRYFKEILRAFDNYTNVKKVEIWLISDGLDEREGNKGTFGGEIEFKIYEDDGYDDYDGENKDHVNKCHTVKIDINFENKKFDIERSNFNIDGIDYNVLTYVYEKILADKYIAFIKHYEYAINSYLNSGSMLTNNGGVNGNVKKLWKDSYDINYINSKQIVDIEKVKKYILMMVEYEINITAINSFIESLKDLHNNITKYRDGYENIQNVILKYSDVILYKAMQN